MKTHPAAGDAAAEALLLPPESVAVVLGTRPEILSALVALSARGAQGDEGSRAVVEAPR